nr:Fic family protein [Sulfurovaceae bacterium]
MSEKKLTNYDTIASKDILKINWTYNSNAIEGNTISLGDTAYIIQYGLTVKGKSIIEHTEVLGHARAIDIVYKFITQDTLTQEDIFLLHQAVQTNIVVDIESPIGRYKVVENGRYVQLSDDKTEYIPYPHPNDIQYLMELWFEKFSELKNLDDFESCIEIYTDMHLCFTSIHPFFDGNGRVARLLANIPLLKNNYLPIIIDNKDKGEYIKLLSSYNLKAKILDKNTKILLDKNDEYEKLKIFFLNQYKNSKKLL